MRKTLILGLSALAMAWGPGASAEDGAVFVRGSLAYGTYKYDDSSGNSDSGKSLGFGVGSSLSMGRFLADFGIDYSKITGTDGVIPAFGRTDVTLTGGYRVLDWMSLFAGYRLGYQGFDSTGVFSDDFWSESGFFVGAGFGPAELTPSLRLSGSLAYNMNEAEYDSGGSLDYNGLGAKLRLGFAGTPHAAELRYQKFKTDEDVGDFEDTYLSLAYIFTW